MQPSACFPPALPPCPAAECGPLVAPISSSRPLTSGAFHAACRTAIPQSLLASPTLLTSCDTISKLIPHFLVPGEQGSNPRRTSPGPASPRRPLPSLLAPSSSPGPLSPVREGSLSAAASPTWKGAALLLFIGRTVLCVSRCSLGPFPTGPLLTRMMTFMF